VSDQADEAIGRGDVLIEFTVPHVTVAHAQLCKKLMRPIVIGTTGLSEAELATIRDASKIIPVLLSPNMSVGVNVLFELAQIAAKRLGMLYDVEVIEGHHRTKKDSPSGTAKRLVDVLAEVRQQPGAAIPVHAIRAGDIVGDHTVILAGPSERLELTHRAQSRDVFAQGALRAAAFLTSQPPGWYDMTHVLGRGK
jgi:4-hydroxy-tetrahydrodipicolinate reductase